MSFFRLIASTVTIVLLLVALLPSVFASGLINDTTPLYSNLDVKGITSRTWISPNTNPGGPTKAQSSTTALFYSNNPENLVDSDMQVGKATILMQSSINVGQKYRVYVAHTNKSSQDLDIAVLIKGTSSGTFTMTKKAVGDQDWNGWSSNGLLATQYFLNHPINLTYNLGTTWSYFDGGYNLGFNMQHNFQGIYEFTVNSGSGVQLVVAVSPHGANFPSLLNAGATRLAVKTPIPSWTPDPESGGRYGVFNGDKNISLTVNLDNLAADSTAALMDRIGHFTGSDTSPTSDTGIGPSYNDGFGLESRTNDGWMNATAGWSDPKTTYLTGNYAVIYHYTVNFTGTTSTPVKKGAVLIGPKPTSTAAEPWGLVVQRSGELAQSLGPTTDTNAVLNAWLVGKDLTPGSTLTFDVMIPGNIDLPYHVYFTRYQ